MYYYQMQAFNRRFGITTYSTIKNRKHCHKMYEKGVCLVNNFPHRTVNAHEKSERPLTSIPIADPTSCVCILRQSLYGYAAKDAYLLAVRAGNRVRKINSLFTQYGNAHPQPFLGGKSFAKLSDVNKNPFAISSTIREHSKILRRNFTKVTP